MKLFFLICVAAHVALWLVCKSARKPQNAEDTMESSFGITIITIAVIITDAAFVVTAVVRWLLH